MSGKELLPEQAGIDQSEPGMLQRGPDRLEPERASRARDPAGSQTLSRNDPERGWPSQTGRERAATRGTGA